MKGTCALTLLTISNSDWGTIASVTTALGGVFGVLIWYLSKLLKDKTDAVTQKIRLDNVIDDILEIKKEIGNIWNDLIDKGKLIEHIDTKCNNNHHNK